MTYRYQPQGVCSRGVTFDIEDGIVRHVKFEGGCSGNTQGVAALIDGMNAEEAVRRLSGIRCGSKASSCPDQLAKAIEQALQNA